MTERATLTLWLVAASVGVAFVLNHQRVLVILSDAYYGTELTWRGMQIALPESARVRIGTTDNAAYLTDKDDPSILVTLRTERRTVTPATVISDFCTRHTCVEPGKVSGGETVTHTVSVIYTESGLRRLRSITAVDRYDVWIEFDGTEQGFVKYRPVIDAIIASLVP